MADLTHDLGGRAVDKNSYTGKCIIIMASLTEVRFKRNGALSASATRTTLRRWCRSERSLVPGAGQWTYACVDTNQCGDMFSLLLFCEQYIVALVLIKIFGDWVDPTH